MRDSVPLWMCFFFQAEDCIRAATVTGVQTCALPIFPASAASVRDVAGLLRRTGWRSGELQAFRRSRARQNQFVREFKRAGGLVAAGSDAANQLLIPGVSLHEELSLLVAVGLPPGEARTAATRKGDRKSTRLNSSHGSSSY